MVSARCCTHSNAAFIHCCVLDGVCECVLPPWHKVNYIQLSAGVGGYQMVTVVSGGICGFRWVPVGRVRFGWVLSGLNGCGCLGAGGCRGLTLAFPNHSTGWVTSGGCVATPL